MPLSGAGAATHGGRVNRPGIEALYLALDVQTAIDEYKQVSTLLPPGTFVTYQIGCAMIVDFREGFNAREWDPLWEDFYCDWRALWFNNRIEPPSWVLGDMVLSAGAKGVLFNSRVASTGTNLVLYPSMFNEADTVSVFDPPVRFRKTKGRGNKRSGFWIPSVWHFQNAAGHHLSIKLRGLCEQTIR